MSPSDSETVKEQARQSRLRRPAFLVPAALAVVAAVMVGLALFQPWRLFVDQQVNEALPSETTVGSQEQAPAGAAPGSTPAPSVPPAAPAVLASGSFISHEYPTTGTVQILQLPDGSRVLRIENLNTTNGPDLKVWLTNAPVIEGVDGWGVFDDGQWVDLGALKGNQGSQNYEIPADVDLSGLTSMSIWCDRFNVSFGAASLVAA